MSDDAKLAYMTSTVMPEMRTVFASYDSARYARMTCATCHGSDGERRRWKMPNPDLLVEAEDIAAPHARMSAFMAERVVPRMAALLGRTSYGCLDCHTVERE